MCKGLTESEYSAYGRHTLASQQGITHHTEHNSHHFVFKHNSLVPLLKTTPRRNSLPSCAQFIFFLPFISEHKLLRCAFMQGWMQMWPPDVGHDKLYVGSPEWHTQNSGNMSCGHQTKACNSLTSLFCHISQPSYQITGKEWFETLSSLLPTMHPHSSIADK